MSAAIAVAPSSHSSSALGSHDSDRRRISRSPKHYMATSSAAPGNAASASSLPQSSPRAPVEVVRSRSPKDDRLPPHNQEAATSAPSNAPRSSHSRSPLNHKNTSPSVTSAPLLPIIKKEHPPSPDSNATAPGSSRHRPQRLDLSNSMASNKSINAARPSAPLTSKDVLMDAGLACLSPGFQTKDPTMQQQLARSMDLREQQRQIIESRLHRTAKDGGAPSNETPRSHNGNDGALSSASMPKTPASSRRKGPPPGLAITAPSPQRFANERVIQSAPLNQTFTGLRQGHGHPLSRQVLDPQQNQQSMGLHSSSNQVHHLPANQTANRLPPISDVFAQEGLSSSGQPHSPNRPEPQRTNSGPTSALHPYDSTNSPRLTSHPNQMAGALPSPGLPPLSASGPGPGPGPSQAPHNAPQHHRDREFRSAEEALHSLSGGREDLLPKHVHYNGHGGGSGAPNSDRHAQHQHYYGGHQPPTPPSPLPSGSAGKPPGIQPGISQQQAYLTPQQSSSRRPPAPIPAPLGGGSSRRRTREEFEQDLDRRDSAEAARRGPGGPGFGLFGGGRDSPETMRRKKERFLQLADEAWDLLHS